METPLLFFGSREDSAFLLGDSKAQSPDYLNYLDRGEVYNLYAKTNRYAPAGAGGECIFTSLYAVFTFKKSMLVYVTPILDGAELETQTIQLLQNPTASRQTRAFELGLSVPLAVAGIERGRVAPRGTWMQTLVETRFNLSDQKPAQLIVDGIELEYEIVRESQMPGTAR